MATTARARKPFELSEEETLTSYQNWQDIIEHNLYLDSMWQDFLPPNGKLLSWEKLTKANATRGFVNDPNTVKEEVRRTAAQKCEHLKRMLGFIAGYAPILPHNTIVKQSTSITSIWRELREYYCFACTGAQFLDLASITLQPRALHRVRFG